MRKNKNYYLFCEKRLVVPKINLLWANDKRNLSKGQWTCERCEGKVEIWLWTYVPLENELPTPHLHVYPRRQ